jgi:deoxyribodipyrimidine photo-lyase
MALRTLVWFRGKDLRLSDHLPLARALQGDEVIPLFVLDPFFFSPARARELPHRMQFLLESIAVLQDELAARGSQLLVVPGEERGGHPRAGGAPAGGPRGGAALGGALRPRA